MRSLTAAGLLIAAAAPAALADLDLDDPFSRAHGGTVASRLPEVLISEILGSTSGTDWEFIEICNTGSTRLDISGWAIELWDSDEGASFGGADGGGPHVVGGGVFLDPGATYVFGNDLAMAGYPQPPYRFDQAFAQNSVENSSYTAILADAAGAMLDAVFISDGGAGDAANRAGSSITPSMTVGPDGSNLPAGFARTDLGGGHVLLHFDTALLADGTLEGGTPGICQIPAPASGAALALAGALLARRRR